MMGMRLLALFFLFAALVLGAATAHAHGLNLTLAKGAPANFSNSFNSTLSYIQMANQSSYLVFYPNLTDAYFQLYMAKANYTRNISLAYAQLANARADAAVQLARIYSYRPISLAIMVALTVAAAAALYVVMHRPKVVGKGRKRAR